jgi:signal transduction histidine kinase
MALGLAAVCGIVKQSGGTMGVESRPEGGTVIRIYLPRVGSDQRVPQPPVHA